MPMTACRQVGQGDESKQQLSLTLAASHFTGFLFQFIDFYEDNGLMDSLLNSSILIRKSNNLMDSLLHSLILIREHRS